MRGIVPPGGFVPGAVVELTRMPAVFRQYQGDASPYYWEPDLPGSNDRVSSIGNE